MKRKVQTITLVLVAVFGILSCSKNKGANPDNENGGNGNLTGKLIYTFTGNVYQLDLQTNRQSTYFTFNTYGFNSWDMGLDRQFRLTSKREAGVFDVAKITLIRNSDGTIADEFDDVSPKGVDTDIKALLSPDNKKVLYSPTFDKWLPGNRIVFTLNERHIFQSDPPYTDLTLVKEMPYTVWGNLRANKQGTQLAMMVSNHIYVMDVDGNDLRQVTESSDGEIQPDFSPDGKHLLVAKKSGLRSFTGTLPLSRTGRDPSCG